MLLLAVETSKPNIKVSMNSVEYDEDPDEIWSSDDPNDLGYECPECGHIPTFYELREGVCPDCNIK